MPKTTALNRCFCFLAFYKALVCGQDGRISMGLGCLYSKCFILVIQGGFAAFLVIGKASALAARPLLPLLSPKSNRQTMQTPKGLCKE